MSTMTIKQRLDRPAFVQVRITRPGRYGKVGSVIQFSADRAEQVVAARYGEIVTEDAPKPRRAKPQPENKAIGA